MIEYTQRASSVTYTKYGQIFTFESAKNKNIDDQVVNDFGEEWTKFDEFDAIELQRIGSEYFDIIENLDFLNNRSVVLDAGCGTGRWSKVLSEYGVGHIEAIDPSKAAIVAQKMLNEYENIRVSRASIHNIPFKDETFDLVMSIGVLHHIPDTVEALKNLVSKIKSGGYFYGYLYYNFENRSRLFKALFYISNLIRIFISRLPAKPKSIVCDFIALTLYMPFVLLSRSFKLFFRGDFYKKIPLSYYHNKSLQIIRNDALDRFGTRLEKRYSKAQIIDLCQKCGLSEVVFSDQEPYWHFIAKKQT